MHRAPRASGFVLDVRKSVGLRSFWSVGWVGAPRTQAWLLPRNIWSFRREQRDRIADSTGQAVSECHELSQSLDIVNWLSVETVTSVCQVVCVPKQLVLPK